MGISVKKKTLVLPHVQFGDTLAGEKFIFDSINGGMVNVADKGYNPFTFFGGNTEVMGLVKEMGFYLLPLKDTRTILGIYLPELSEMTKKGRELVKKHYQGFDISNESEQEEIEEKRDDELIKKLSEEFVEAGGSPALVKVASANELKGLINALKSGQSDKVIAEVEQNKPTVAATQVRVKKPSSTGTPNQRIANQVRKVNK